MLRFNGNRFASRGFRHVRADGARSSVGRGSWNTRVSLLRTMPMAVPILQTTVLLRLNLKACFLNRSVVSID